LLSSYKVFYSVDELNDAIAILLDRYNNKIMKHLGKSRTELFEELQKEVEVRYSTNHVRIYYNNEIIATHPRLRRAGEFSTIPEHRTPQHAYIHNKWNPERLRSWAKSIGEYSSLFVEDCFEAVEYKEHAYKKIMSVLKMAKEYGYVEFELALEHNLTRTKSIRSVLDKHLYLQKSSNNTSYTASEVFNNYKNLRGANEYK